VISPNPITKPQILIVDAQAHPMRTACTALRQAGHEVVEAVTAADGLRIAREYQPALILLDVNLPDMSGLEACRRIKADPALAACQVVLLSTRDATVDEQTAALGAGADEYILRPIADRALVVRVDRLLRARQAEAALRESEDRLRTLIESQGEGIGIVDLQERFTFANPAAHGIFGVPPGALVGRSVLDFLDPDQAAVVRAQTQRRGEGERSTYELEITRPDGEMRTLLVTAAPQWGPEGQLVGAFGIFRDVTDRATAERALLEVRDLLEARAAERTAQLVESNRTLLKRTNELALLNRSIQAFSSSLDTQQVLASILEEVRRLLNASACSGS
jgi:PAS domain S-box-containing protein